MQTVLHTCLSTLNDNGIKLQLRTKLKSTKFTDIFKFQLAAEVNLLSVIC